MADLRLLFGHRPDNQDHSDATGGDASPVVRSGPSASVPVSGAGTPADSQHRKDESPKHPVICVCTYVVFGEPAPRDASQRRRSHRFPGHRQSLASRGRRTPAKKTQLACNRQLERRVEPGRSQPPVPRVAGAIGLPAVPARNGWGRGAGGQPVRHAHRHARPNYRLSLFTGAFPLVACGLQPRQVTDGPVSRPPMGLVGIGARQPLRHRPGCDLSP